MAAKQPRVLATLAFAAVIAVGALAVMDRSDISSSETATSISVPNAAEVYDPVRAGETLPAAYRDGLPRDAIVPVYEPTFTNAGAVEWPGDSLVIGVAGDTTAKAYPVTHLNSHEMVIDSLEGIPILVTW